MLQNTLHNKIYYFYTGYQDDFEYELRHYVECGEACNTKNLKPLYNINNVDSFMKACKKLK